MVGSKLGSDDGITDSEDIILGCALGALVVEGESLGIVDGSPDTDGAILGSDDGIID